MADQICHLDGFLEAWIVLDGEPDSKHRFSHGHGYSNKVFFFIIWGWFEGMILNYFHRQSRKIDKEKGMNFGGKKSEEDESLGIRAFYWAKGIHLQYWWELGEKRVKKMRAWRFGLFTGQRVYICNIDERERERELWGALEVFFFKWFVRPIIHVGSKSFFFFDFFDKWVSPEIHISKKIRNNKNTRYVSIFFNIVMTFGFKLLTEYFIG